MHKDARLLIIFALLLETLIVVLINQQIYISQDIKQLKTFLPYINLVIILLSGLVLIAVKKLEENAKKIIEANLLKAHLTQVEDLLKALQIQKHEHSRHIQIIQAMLYLGETNKAAEYIEGIADSYRLTGKTMRISHPAMAALINSKQKIAETQEVEFVCAIKCDTANLSLPPWDLCSILGNLIDNALEAAILNQIHRRVAVEIKQENTDYIIRVANTGPAIPDKIRKKLFNAGYSTKESTVRGYGLYLVKNLVDKYGGKIDVISKAGTTFIIHFPCPNKKDKKPKA